VARAKCAAKERGAAEKRKDKCGGKCKTSARPRRKIRSRHSQTRGLLAPVNGIARSKVRRNGRDSKKQSPTPRRTLAAGMH
jgi:hypothetical protein